MGIQNYVEGGEAPPRNVSKMAPFVLIITFFFAVLHYLVYLITARSLSDIQILFSVKATLITGLMLMPSAFILNKHDNKSTLIIAWCGYVWMGLFNLLLFFSVIELAISFFISHHYSYWPVPITIVIGIWALYNGIKHPTISRYKIKNSTITNFKIVQISDLHIGMLHLNERWLRRVVRKIKDCEPDMVALTGDLVEGSFSTISPQLSPLAELPPHIPKFYITGNHEYIHGSGSWEKRLEELGFIVLHNQNFILDHKGKKILVAGVPDRMIGRFIKNKESLPDLALTTTDSVDYKILLAHEPSSVFDIKKETCDLILTGHTHGGQIFPFHLLVRLVQPVVRGFKKINKFLVFNHQGTGFWGPPLRWFSKSEIALLIWP